MDKNILHSIGLDWLMINDANASTLSRIDTKTNTVVNKFDATTHTIQMCNKKICNGACGDIFMGTFDGTCVVFKQINDSVDDAIKEAIIHAILHHYSMMYGKQFVLPLLFVYYDPVTELVTLVLEKCDGTIKDLMVDKSKHSQIIQTFLHEWDAFVEYLNAHHIYFYHNDLRPANVLYKITDTNQAMLMVCDFGMAYIEMIEADDLQTVISTSKGLFYSDLDDTHEMRKLRDIYTFLFTHDTPTTFEEVKQMKKKWKNMLAFYTHFIKDYVKHTDTHIVVDGIVLHNAYILLHL